MKWTSHITLTGTIAYAVTQDPLPAAAACVGAILPDKIEGTPGSVGWSSWRSRHRGWSHWPVLYIALLGALTHTTGSFFYDAAFFSVLRWVLVGRCSTSRRTPSAARCRSSCRQGRSACVSLPSAPSASTSSCSGALYFVIPPTVSQRSGKN